MDGQGCIRAGSAVDIGEAFTDRVSGENGDTVEIKLFHEIATMRIHCVGGDFETSGDFARVESFGDKLEDFTFTSGEAGHGRSVFR